MTEEKDWTPDRCAALSDREGQLLRCLKLVHAEDSPHVYPSCVEQEQIWDLITGFRRDQEKAGDSVDLTPERCSYVYDEERGGIRCTLLKHTEGAHCCIDSPAWALLEAARREVESARNALMCLEKDNKRLTAELATVRLSLSLSNGYLNSCREIAGLPGDTLAHEIPRELGEKLHKWAEELNAQGDRIKGEGKELEEKLRKSDERGNVLLVAKDKLKEQLDECRRELSRSKELLDKDEHELTSLRLTQEDLRKEREGLLKALNEFSEALNIPIFVSKDEIVPLEEVSRFLSQRLTELKAKALGDEVGEYSKKVGDLEKKNNQLKGSLDCLHATNIAVNDELERTQSCRNHYKRLLRDCCDIAGIDPENVALLPSLMRDKLKDPQRDAEVACSTCHTLYNEILIIEGKCPRCRDLRGARKTFCDQAARILQELHEVMVVMDRAQDPDLSETQAELQVGSKLLPATALIRMMRGMRDGEEGI